MGFDLKSYGFHRKGQASFGAAQFATINVTGASTMAGLTSSAGITISAGDMTAPRFLASGNGTVGAPAYSWSADTDTGVYRSAADILGLSTAAAVRALLDASSVRTQNSAAVRTGGRLNLQKTTGASGVAVNDFAIGNNSFLLFTPTAAINMTGMVAQDDGAVVPIVNTGVFNLSLLHENAGSAAANRFQTPNGAAQVLVPQGVALCIYETTNNRWRVALVS